MTSTLTTPREQTVGPALSPAEPATPKLSRDPAESSGPPWPLAGPPPPWLHRLAAQELPALPALPDLSDAACRGAAGFDDEEDPATRRVATRICAACPVREACLRAALATHPAFCRGTWAGTSPRQREQLRAHYGIRFARWDTRPRRRA
jgi:hypothetical protein